MTNPTTMPAQFNQGADKVIAGSTIEAWLLFDVDLPDTASVEAGHGLGLVNASKERKPSSALQGLSLKGGVTAVAQVITLTVSAVPADGEQSIVAGVNLVYDATGPTANQVDTTSGTNNGVATQLGQEINQQIASVDATIATNVVTVTASTPGTAITFDESTATGDVTIATVTANVVGVKASISITLAGDLYADTISDFNFYYTSESKTREVHLQHVVQADSSATITKDSAAAGTYLTSFKLCFANAINGVASDSENRYFTSNVDDGDGEVQDFMVDYFVADTSFTIVSNRLKIEAGVAGSDGNNIKVAVQTLASAPSPLPSFNASLVPQFDTGVVVHAGINDEGKATSTAEILKIKGSNAFGDIISIQGDSTDSFSIKLQINNDPEFLAKIVRTGNITYDDTRNIFTTNNNNVKSRIGVLLVYRSKGVKGARNAKWYYDCIIEGAVDRETSLRGIGGYTLTAVVQQDLERSGDPKLVEWNPRVLG